MPVELWGASGAVKIVPPTGIPGFFLLILLLSLTLLLLFRQLPQLQKMKPNLRYWTVALAVAGFIFSQLFPFDLFPAIPRLAGGGPVGAFFPFLFAPLLLAAAMLPPGGALLVGLGTGLGTALGQSHLFADVFVMGLAGYIAAHLLQQHYDGNAFRLLRRPLITALLAALLTVFLHGLTVAAATNLPALAALDRTLVVVQTQTPLRLAEALIGGLIAIFVLHNLPALRPTPETEPSPIQRTLNRQLTANTVVFAAFISLGTLLLVSWLVIRISTFLVVSQLAQNARAVGGDLPGFQQQLAQLVAEQAAAPTLLGSDSTASTKELARLFNLNPDAYRNMLLVNPDGEIAAAYPNAAALLTEQEVHAVATAVFNKSPAVSAAAPAAGRPALSFLVPLRSAAGSVEAVLIGRATELTMNNLILSLQGELTDSRGFIVDETNRVIIHQESGQLHSDWTEQRSALRPLSVAGIPFGNTFFSWDQEHGGRELLFTYTPENQQWQVVTAVPYTLVLDQAVTISIPLFSMLLLLTVGFVVANRRIVDQNISRPLNELVEAANTLTAGGAWEPSSAAAREDEIGQLHFAFDHMQRSIRKQLHDMSLLLSVSQDVSATLDFTRGIPAILRGALRGTAAAGARAVLVSPTSGRPLTYSEGPAAPRMAALDRSLMIALRQHPELMLTSPAQITAALDLPDDSLLPVPALLAVSLQMQNRFLGIIWLGYHQKSHTIEMTERHLLHTLGAQAAVLMENTRLYASAESGRRRLSAVLASVSDAVVVTDQTDRILLLNRAAEKLFDLRIRDVRGRALRDVLPHEGLCAAMTSEQEPGQAAELEIATADGRTHIAAVAMIISNDGLVYGRVAVLRDVTQLKEIDEMKSDFVSTVSHDLRGPLTFMRGYVTMLPMVGELNEKQQAYTDKILSGIDQMSTLVNDLLDLGRIEAGQGLEKETIPVRELLDDIAAEYWQHAHLAGLKIVVETGAEVTTLTADRNLIRRGLTNLLENSIKYAPRSGHILLGAHQHNNHMVFRIQDNGPGIPLDAQAKLFEKFYRVKRRGMERIKGSGLGLAIVRSIAEQHGGRATVRSKPGNGASFFIAIPLSPPETN